LWNSPPKTTDNTQTEGHAGWSLDRSFIVFTNSGQEVTYC
jgi:hypothetical protein